MFFEPTNYITTAKAPQDLFQHRKRHRFFRFSGCKSSSGLRVLPVSLLKPGLGSTYVTWLKASSRCQRPFSTKSSEREAPGFFVGRLTSVIKCEEVKFTTKFSVAYMLVVIFFWNEICQMWWVILSSMGYNVTFMSPCGGICFGNFF